jgi:oligopeptidase A
LVKTYAGLQPKDLEADLEHEIRLADGAIDRAIAVARTDDARAVLSHLEQAARHSIAGYGRSAALRMVHPDLAIREAAGDAQAHFDAWQASVFARADLFAALEVVNDTSLSPAERRHLDLWRANGRINGAHLDAAARDEMKAAQERASQLSVEIAERFTAEAPIMELTLEELDGLPAQLLDTLEPGAAPGTRRLRVEFATRDEVLTGVRRRDVRERFWWLLGERSADTNREPMRELFELRRRVAQLAGFASWADLRTSTAAMRTVDAATASLDALDGPARPAAEAFIAACSAALGDGHGDAGFEPWDQYVAVAELGRGLGVDRERLRRFLPLQGVLDGLFRLSREVFGIRVEERPHALGWHDDVRMLALVDEATGEEIGVCLFDPYSRDGKDASSLAFMDLLASDGPAKDGLQPPGVTMLVTMFPKPAGGRPTLLSVGDVDALFHEFGHVLDFTIGSRRWPVMDAGWWGSDWVEGPSMSMGNWACAPAVLATFARDPDTGETIPVEVAEALAATRSLEHLPYLERYLALGRLDLAVHGPATVDLDEAWRRAWAQNPVPQPAERFQPFNMIMAVSGYDGALYGVSYAMVVRDAILSAFARDGWLNGETGRRYVSEVLAPGPFVPPVERLAAFLGHALSADPLLAGVASALEIARAGAKATAMPVES